MDKLAIRRIRVAVLTAVAAITYVGGAISLSPLLAQYLPVASQDLAASVSQTQATAAPPPEITENPEEALKKAEAQAQAEQKKRAAQRQVVSVRQNPFAGARLFVDPNSPARRQVNTWQSTRPGDAALISKIANNSVGIWLGGLVWRCRLSYEAVAWPDAVTRRSSSIYSL